MFVLIECKPDRLSVLKNLAERVYGTRVVCVSPDLATLPDRIEDAVIVDAKARAESARGLRVLTGPDLADYLDGAESADMVPPDQDDGDDNDNPDDRDATPILVPA